MNTNRRKSALINAINLSRKSGSNENSNSTEKEPLPSQTYRGNSTYYKKDSMLLPDSLNEKKTKRYNYYLSEDFE